MENEKDCIYYFDLVFFLLLAQKNLKNLSK